jgi:EAL domain-containing protein (putative c-di-GMP-specific phosphodiesterase class I)
MDDKRDSDKHPIAQIDPQVVAEVKDTLPPIKGSKPAEDGHGTAAGRQIVIDDDKVRDTLRTTLKAISSVEMESLQTPSTLDLPRRLTDPVTGVSSLTSLHKELANVLDTDERVSVFYLHLPNSSIVEDRYGWEAMEAFMGAASHYLLQMGARFRRERGAASLNGAFADDFVMLCPGRDDEEQFRMELAQGLERHMRMLDSDLASASKVYVGIAGLRQLPRLNRERLVYRAIQEAQQDAMDVGKQILQSQARVLDECIAEQSFVMHYQPIVDIESMKIFGYEALVRCQKPELANPYVLFDVADKSDRTRALTRVLRRIAVRAIDDLESGQYLFLNLHPTDLEDPELVDPPDWMRGLGDQVVLEITERAAIEDFKDFRARLQNLRDLGFRVAIDDLGSGYSALNNVAELEPELLKFDMLLIRGIDESEVRQNLVKQLVKFAHGINCRVVAEGIEHRTELNVVQELGCDLGQGFFLARPAPELLREIKLTD